MARLPRTSVYLTPYASDPIRNISVTNFVFFLGGGRCPRVRCIIHNDDCVLCGVCVVLCCVVQKWRSMSRRKTTTDSSNIIHFRWRTRNKSCGWTACTNVFENIFFGMNALNECNGVVNDCFVGGTQNTKSLPFTKKYLWTLGDWKRRFELKNQKI